MRFCLDFSQCRVLYFWYPKDWNVRLVVEFHLLLTVALRRVCFGCFLACTQMNEKIFLMKCCTGLDSGSSFRFSWFCHGCLLVIRTFLQSMVRPPGQVDGDWALSERAVSDSYVVDDFVASCGLQHTFWDFPGQATWHNGIAPSLFLLSGP